MVPPDAEVTPSSLSLVCPTCGATAQSGPECRRCHSDLHTLQQVLAQRATLLHTLAQALGRARWAEALQCAQAVHHLRQDPESFRLLAVCHHLNQQPAAAYETHRQYSTLQAQQP